MIGCRPFEDDEISDISERFSGYMEHRNRLLFHLGITTGFRVSEMLSLRIADVYKSGRIVEQIRIRRQHSKGRQRGQSAHVAPMIRPLIKRWLLVVWERYEADPLRPLFPSRSGPSSAITRMQAWRFLQKTCTEVGVEGSLGEVATHSMRKTYAKTMHAHFDDIFSVQKALRHQSPASTVAYLSFDEREITDAVDLKWPDPKTNVSNNRPINITQIQEML